MPALVRAESSLTWSGSIDVKLKHDVPCIRFFNPGDMDFSN